MAEGQERIGKWLEKLKSNDSEVKVDAINKLQAEFLAGVQPSDVEEVITALKTSLRIPNQHISTASMSAIASLFPVLIDQQGDDHHALNSHDSNVLRHALTAFFSAGGIVDRLGDNREKARDCAREALVSAGTVVSRSNPPHGQSHPPKPNQATKGPEPPLAIFERFLRELGFSSKVSRVREQSILTLVNLRRANPHFPLRPFLASLVETLEDSDGGVRDCARASVIEMFTAPTVTDGARAELKKEMTKKGVRKAIVDSVLGQLFSSSTQAASSSGPPHEEEPQPAGSGFMPRRGTASTLAVSTAGPSRTVSAASLPAGELPETPKGEGTQEVVTVYIASSRDLEHEFAEMLPHFEGRESEHNWQPRDRAVSRVRGMLQGDVHVRFTDAFMEGLKGGFMTGTLKTLASLRTTVATNTCTFYVELVHALGTAYEPFVELTITPLFRLGSLTKKIVANLTQSTAKEILLHAHPAPRLVLPMLWMGIQDKNLSIRQYTLEHLQTVIQTSTARNMSLIETTGGLELIERSIKKALQDPNAGLRDRARALFWVFEPVWRDRAEAIANTLDATARKQLDKAAPSGLSPLVLAPPQSAAETKKSSVAAAIAASRAKARQIAAAPPTLRHAATAHASSMASQSRKPPSPTSSSTAHTGPSSPPHSSKRTSGVFQRTATSPSFGQAINRVSTNVKAPSNGSLSPPSSPTQSPTRKPLHISRAGPAPTSPSSYSHQRSPPTTTVQPKSSLSARSLSPPAAPARTAQPKRASGVFSSPKGNSLSPIPVANDTLPISPQHSDDESLMRVRAPNSDAGSNESLPMASFSDAVTSTPPGRTVAAAGLTMSTNPLKVPGPVIEDALRLRAEQAESAAERLLEELVEPNETVQNIHLPPSLVSSGSTSSTPRKGAPPPPKSNGTIQRAATVPVTPANNRASVLKQAATFQDSPQYKPGSRSIIAKLQENRNESSWWLKRVALLQNDNTSKTLGQEDLKKIIQEFEGGNLDISLLKDLAIISSQNPAEEESALSLDNVKTDDIWEGGSRFRKLLASLFQQLTSDKPEEVLEYGLIVIWEMLENQQTYLEGRESELLSLLFHLRYANKQTISEASNTIRDALASRIDPVYGLSTTHSSLKSFLAEPTPAHGSADSRALSHAFGLLALGKFILRLPTEILEDELPRLQLTLAQGLNDTQLLVREAAAAAITAAQIILQDETYLFTMLASLTEEKKNLLTYLFDKHGARGAVEGVTAGNTAQGGLDKLDKEMRRLDSRTSTPLRKP